MATLDLFNSEAEALFLAGLLRNPDAYWDVNDTKLTAADFFGPENKRVMKAVEAVVASKRTPELPLIVEELRVAGRETSIEYLSKLHVLAASTAQAKEYGRTVKGLSASRQLATAGARIIELAQSNRSDAETAIAEAESELRKVRATAPGQERSAHPMDIMRRLRSEARDAQPIQIRFSPTLNEKTEGLHRGHLWVIGGFSSTGKSAVACNLIGDILGQSREDWVGVISTEMTAEQYLIRLLSLASGVPQKMLRQRVTLPFMDGENLARAERGLQRAPLRIWDTKYKMSDIRSTLIRQSETDGLRVAFVDFLQNLRATGEGEYSQMTNAILELQELAKELNITVVAFSQLSNSMARDLNDPDASKEFYAFKGSGAIKDAADVAIILKRDRHITPGILDWNVQKVRHGEAPFTIETKMDLPTGRIDEVQYQMEESPDAAAA